MDNHNAVLGTPSRRLVLGSAAAVAVTALTTPVASARSRSDGHLRHSVMLPDGTQPEGITSGPGATFYVGSVADGRIVKGNLRTGTVRTLLAGMTGRSLRGLFFDR
ncbi:MAG: hypothetical protein ACKOVB_12270, partial [Terrabacter sp.]